MKICFIHNLWGKDARGGAEQVLQTLITYLQDKGHTVVMITVGRAKELTVEQTPAGLTVYSVPSPYNDFGSWSYMRRLFWHITSTLSKGSYSVVQNILEKEKPELVWTHNLLGLGNSLLRVGDSNKWRHIHTLHDIQLLHPSGLLYYGREGWLRTPAAKIYQLLLRRKCSSQTTVISPSQWLLALHRQYGFFLTQPTLVLANPSAVPETDISPEVSAQSSFNFLHVGQVEEHKGIRMLIQAFLKVARPDWRLEIVGKGSLLRELQTQHIDTRLVFLGQQPATVVKKKMTEAQCLVVPSLCYENFPTVVSEAMSVGLPVLGSDCGGIKEMLQDPRLLFAPQQRYVEEKLLWGVENYEEMKRISLTRYQEFKPVTVTEYCRALGLEEIIS